MVNALILYNDYNRSVPGFQPLPILKFREHIIYSLVEVTPRASPVKCPKKQHILKKFEIRDASNRLVRKNCASCYAKMKMNESRSAARNRAKKVSTK